MKPLKSMTVLVAGLMLAGCAALDLPSRNAGFVPGASDLAVVGPDGGAALNRAQIAMVRVDRIEIDVPKSLVVSEENSFYPAGDIVWRGEPAGDRYRQIKRIFEEGITRGTAPLEGAIPVVLDIRVQRFHSVTEKTRYTFGGVHSIRFVMTLFDASTGAPLTGPKVVKANLKAFGGQTAVNAERQGQTQRVRIVDHLARVIQTELGRPPLNGKPGETLVLNDKAAF